jgi:hypothetical protein
LRQADRRVAPTSRDEAREARLRPCLSFRDRRAAAGEESSQAMPMLASSPGKGTPMLPWGGIPRPIMETLRPCRASEWQLWGEMLDNNVYAQ